MATSRPLLLAIAASACLALLTPVAASAKPTPEFQAMDSNNDGVVSSSEHEAYARRMFDLMDTNQDDQVTVAEVDASVGKVKGHAAGARDMNAAQRIRKRDVNADGIISWTEYAMGAAAKFREMDVDNNNQLTQQELDAGS